VRVAVLCEFSGTVRDAFIRRGHDAVSCDLLPTESPGPHIVGDCLAHDWSGYDLVIAHPPCTYLCNSGVRWLAGNHERMEKMRAAAEFFRSILALPVPMLAVENPIPHGHAGLPKYTQIVHPWQHGHGESKATCLWLRGLSPLVPTRIVDGRVGRVHREPPGPNRWKTRSKTYPGIADAMAEQWGSA
jgi:hypothetical protein